MPLNMCRIEIYVQQRPCDNARETDVGRMCYSVTHSKMALL